MKKYILFLISILFLSNINILSARCDQVFDGGMVRYNYTYNFYDDFISKSKDVYLNTFNIDYINPSFLNTRGITNPFHWTEELKNNNYKVPANTTMRILEAGTNRLQIASLPQSRTNGTRNSYDFGIEYTTSYDYSNNFPNASDDISHKECVYYSVSWCGDSIIDSSYGETCDNGNLNGTAGNSCNSTCQITQSNSCDVGTVSGAQSSPISASTPGLCKTGIAVNSFKSVTNGDTINYSWACGPSTTGGACVASYGTSGGGGLPSCDVGPVSGAQSSPISASTPGLCKTGAIMYSFSNITTGNTINYSWACDSSTIGGACVASYLTSGGSGGGSSCGNGVINSGEECDLGLDNNSKYACSTSCKITKCGDGVLQRPNGNAQFEECDFGSSNWPSWCSRGDCKIRGDNTSPSEGGGDYTMPSDKDGIIFYPSGGAILGDSMKLFATYNLDRPYIKNNTGYDLYIEKPLCLYKENKSSLEGNLSICSSGNIGELSAGAKFQINTNDYTANTDNLIGAFESVKLFTAPQGLQNSYLSSTLKVIVAKSSIGSISGGTSLLNYDSNYYSDIDTVSKNFLTDLRNKNFIVTSISQNNGFSSYVNKIENLSVYNESLSEWNNSNQSINKFYNFSYNSTGYTLPTENYNGISNVFTHKGDLVLNGQSIVGNKTYVIQDGDLYINGNIDLISGNIAFIVKGGNIIISNSVTGLEGIYITIKENNIGGNINSDSIKTNNRLIINGGLYGDVKDLISNRTYMKSDNGIINVGTVINFKSGIFKNPPPLLTSFVEEYMKVNKIAK